MSAVLDESAEELPTEVGPGSRIALTIDRVGAGGVCVARYEGRVVFVRHTLPGEHVIAEVREGKPGDRYLRADAVEIVTPSPDRVSAPCPYAGPGKCGGCDWQHVDLAAQRRLKSELVSEQLSRFAGIDREVEVSEVAGAPTGLNWRTRMQFAVDEAGHLGLRKSRSHDIEVLGSRGPCRIAAPGIDAMDPYGVPWKGIDTVEIAVVAGDDAPGLVIVETEQQGKVRLPGLPTSGIAVRHRRPGRGGVARGEGTLEQIRGRGWMAYPAAGRTWRVSAGSFWQVHPGAADALAAAVLDGLDPQPGETALDLYAGVGLFAGTLAERLGEAGSVIAVESAPQAVRDARRNLHELPTVRIVDARVDKALAAASDAPGSLPERADLIVLDPPRSGAGAEVVAAIVARQPRRIAYVACDPAALARDLATFAASGYVLVGLQGFDLFPMTQHVECVAVLAPAG